MGPGHAALADRLAEAYGGEAELATAVEVLERLSKALDAIVGPPVTET
ncbi:hypothetical protein [Streptomyces flaveolus]